MNSRAPIDILPRDAAVLDHWRPVLALLDEMPGATELVINKPGTVLVESGPEWASIEASELTFTRCMHMARVLATYSEQEINDSKPLLSTMLPGGQRVNIAISPAVEAGSISITVRVPHSTVKPISSYIEDGAFDRYRWARPAKLEERATELRNADLKLCRLLEAGDLAGFLTEAIDKRKNIAVVGDTGSGKTTLMKAMCQTIPRHERLITIEDVRELYLPGYANVVHLLYSKGGQGTANITPSDLIAATMRMRPDRVLLAELRGGEAFDFLKLLTTGHSGSITSFHAESSALAFERYVFMAKEHKDAGTYDSDALKKLITLTIDCVIHVVARVEEADGQRRKVRFVDEVHFDPVAKLESQIGDGHVVSARG